jgi:F0F1-type ATP synthase assembly protein I
MAGDQKPPPRRGEPTSTAWTALGYLLAGMAVWGFAGWLVDRWLGTGGIAIGIGIVLGSAGGIFLVMKRFGA